jgi:hypothetical protein
VWITVGFGLTEEDFRRKFSVAVVLFIGVAIATGLACSRHKLSETIVAALQTGYDLSEERARERVEEAEEAAVKRASNHEDAAEKRMQDHEDWMESK